MIHFRWIRNFQDLRLDIVGIVAVLGEGCTARTIDASSLSWHHILPRFIPAPQALLRHEQVRRLPTAEGIVLGAYSGNHSSRLNFFCRLLHYKPLERNTVELVEVVWEGEANYHAQAFGVKPYGPLAALSLLGCAMACALIGLSIHFSDGFALAAAVLLAATSTIVGFASWWRLDFKPPKPQEDRQNDIPDSDLVIYYPSGAFRVVRCTESVSRLYFLPEVCESIVTDDVYRVLALLSSITLMTGLLAMGNAKVELQCSFAVAYISLNIIYWGISAINPMKYHWAHGFKVTVKPFHSPVPRRPLPTIVRRRPDLDTSSVNGISIPDPGTSPFSRHGIPAELSPTSAHEKTQLDTVVENVRQRRIPAKASDDVDTSQQPLSEHRRKTNTDLEAFKQRTLSSTRSLTAPIYRRLSAVNLPVLGSLLTASDSNPSVTKVSATDTTTTKVERRFTEALWTAIALTGTSRWLQNSRIVPDTDAWTNWVVTAGRRARSKKNSNGILIPACTQDENGVLVLPVWNYNDALRQFLRNEDTLKKNAPPDPPTFREFVDSTYQFSPEFTGKLRKWAKKARRMVDYRSRGIIQ